MQNSPTQKHRMVSSQFIGASRPPWGWGNKLAKKSDFAGLGSFAAAPAETNFEKADQAVVDADQMIVMLDQQIQWFSVYQKEFLLKNEQTFKKSGEWEEACKNQKKNEDEIQRSKKEFLKFLDNFIQSLTSMSPDAPYSRALIEHARNQITRKYVQLVQECIFPVRWEVLYDEYLKEKNGT